MVSGLQRDDITRRRKQETSFREGISSGIRSPFIFFWFASFFSIKHQQKEEADLLSYYPTRKELKQLRKQKWWKKHSWRSGGKDSSFFLCWGGSLRPIISFQLCPFLCTGMRGAASFCKRPLMLGYFRISRKLVTFFFHSVNKQLLCMLYARGIILSTEIIAVNDKPNPAPTKGLTSQGREAETAQLSKQVQGSLSIQGSLFPGHPATHTQICQCSSPLCKMV